MPERKATIASCAQPPFPIPICTSQRLSLPHALRSLFASSDAWTPRLAASLPSWLAALRLRPSARLLREYRRALTTQRRGPQGQQARRADGQDGAGTGSSGGSSSSTTLLRDMSAVQLCEVLDGLGAAVGGGVGVWAPQLSPPTSATRDGAGHVPQGQGQGQHADAVEAAAELLAREYGALAVRRERGV